MSKEIEVPELGFLALVRYAWRQLTSMRTALILLMLMGVAAIPGSLIPQRITNQIAVREMFTTNPELAKWYDRFSLFDVYGSPWFSAIYILLFISLIGCVLPRSVEHYKAMRAQPPVTPKNLSRLEHHQEFAGGAESLERAATWFKKNRFRVRVEGNSISAEKGFIRETGNLLFHLSLILILVGVSFGSLFGMRGEAIVSVGERFVNVATSYDSLSFGKLTGEKSLPTFEIKLDKFLGEYDPVTSAPKDYTAWVTITYQGSTYKKEIKVNKPLTF
jgi:cytochrome c biogenesis protein